MFEVDIVVRANEEDAGDPSLVSDRAEEACGDELTH